MSWIPSREFDYHKTFLGRHIDSQLKRTDDVLVVEDIRKAIERLLPSDSPSFQKEKEKANDLLHLRHFFHPFMMNATNTDTQVYQPLKVHEVKNQSNRAASLVDLLIQLDRKKERHGVVLSTISGAGKTVAMRAAFHACTEGEAESEPPLTGFMPCWLSLNPRIDCATLTRLDAGLQDLNMPVAEIKARVSDDTILRELILASADLEPSKSMQKRLSQWLKVGPKMLLFADLNSVGPYRRALVAKALEWFQHGPMGQSGHRVVAAYRTTQPDDSTLSLEVFRNFNVESIDKQRAISFLEALRSYEKFVYTSFGLDVPLRNIAGEQEILGRLIDKHVTGIGSIISTPLMVTLVSRIDPSVHLGESVDESIGSLTAC